MENETQRKPWCKRKASVVRRLAGYIRSGCAKWQGREMRLDPESISRSFGVSLRQVRRALALLRKESAFLFRTGRRGRSFAIFVRLAGSREIQGDIPSYREVFPMGKKESNPSRWEVFRKDSSGIRRLAWAFARRELADEHWDNCKVTFRVHYAFRFVLAALNCGILQEDILSAYRLALHRGHVLATEAGLARRDLVRWEPSGVIAWARQHLGRAPARGGAPRGYERSGIFNGLGSSLQPD
jgi:hypothetical protein